MIENSETFEEHEMDFFFELILIFPNVSCTHMSTPTFLTTRVDESLENSEIFEKHMLRLLFVELIRRSSFDQGLRPAPHEQ